MEFKTTLEIVDKDLEKKEKLREIEYDRNYKSLFLRRHSEWDYGTEDNNYLDLGFLTKDGHQMADESAVELGEKMVEINNKVEEDFEASIYESPSFIPSSNPKELENKDDNPNYDERFPEEIKPQRAMMTGLSYEERIFGGLAPGKGAMHHDGLANWDVPDPVLSRNKLKTTSVSKRLGDFMENVDCEDKSQLGRLIGEFHKLKGELYSNSEEFWTAFIRNELPEELLKSLKACNGSTSLDLTRNMIDFISEKKEKTAEEKKEIVLAITHGETMDSFLHYLGLFLETKGETDHGLDEILFGYNEGFDAHIDSEGNLVIAINVVEKIEGEKKSSIRLIEVKLDEFEDYINKQDGFISTVNREKN
ncbi:MAG: hypothetical protein KAI67_01455 [Candidatus Pacebacteria bacterium]|nr:hypothetical protein [Candidatus Paceibacterota bacterium]